MSFITKHEKLDRIYNGIMFELKKKNIENPGYSKSLLCDFEQF